MANYDFSTLNSTDLENLVCDLLNLEKKYGEHIIYKTFKEGKDKGIDFLFSSDSCDYDHVGQVKHYYRTGYDGLLYVLKNTEVDKLKKLKPNRYIFATSVDLGVSQTKEIKKLFNPYIKNLNDVYGKININQLIDNHSQILEQHHKLWLSDFKVLTKIINSPLTFRSSIFTEHELRKRIRLYVATSILDDAQKQLKDNNFIIITGEPGVGKTTLAEMLIYKFIEEEYNLSYVYTSNELEKAIVNDDSKQLIYFDDFLGSNKYEINDARNSEIFLRKFLRQFQSLKNKYLILTTRTYLINTAKTESEHLENILLKYQETELKLDEYNQETKKEILNNHIEESEIDDDLLEVFKNDEIVNFISKHENFTPRLIEFITTKERVPCQTQSEYKKIIKETFINPQKVWKHAYMEQINREDRLLLNTLFSFGEEAHLDDLREAYIKRLAFERQFNSLSVDVNTYESTISRLNGAYIKIDTRKRVKFINPSLIDFLDYYLKNDSTEIDNIIKSVKYVGQLTSRLFPLLKDNENIFPDELRVDLEKDYNEYLNPRTKDLDLIRLSMIIQKHITDKSISESIIYDLLQNVGNWESLYENYDLHQAFNGLLDNISHTSRIFDLINSEIEEILNQSLLGNNDIDDLVAQLTKWKDLFDIDFSDLDTSQITDHLDDLFSELVFNETEWLLEWATYEDEYNEKRSEIEKLERKINDLGIDYSVDFTEMDNNDWWEVCTDNEFRRQMEKDD